MKILITKLSALGDIVQAWGVLEYLKSTFPESSLDWVVDASNRELIEHHPLISSVISVDTKAIRKDFFRQSGRKALKEAWKQLRRVEYDYVFDLQGNIKSALCVLASRARNKVGWTFKECAESPAALAYTMRISTAGLRSARESNLKLVQKAFSDESEFIPQSFLPQSYLLPISEEESVRLKSYVEKPFWIICPGSKWKNKVYPFEKLKQALQLVDHPELIFVTGGGVESRLVEEGYPGCSHLVKPSFPFLQRLMSHAQLVVGMDSLPIHLSGSASVPTFALFGPSRSEAYFPESSSRGIFQGSCPYGREFIRRCPILRTCPTGACLREVVPEEIAQKLKMFLHNLNEA